jgi:nucleoside-diphosphate-sugar epimerase
LTGASSQIGVFAIRRLVRAGFHVFAISRKGKPENYPVLEQVTWLSGIEAIPASRSCQYLISAGPMTLAKKFLEAGDQFQAVVVFSSSSVESKQNSADPVERRLAQDMLTQEKELQDMAGSRKLKLVILRPTLIYGCGLDSNISRLANWISRFGIMPVNGKANGLRQPVHADDLASVAIVAMQNMDGLPGVLVLTGGDTLSYSEMVSRIFMATKKPVRLLRLPEWLFILSIKILGASRGINAEMVKRQRVDLVFDSQQAKNLLAYCPREFIPTEEDFSLPGF